MDCNDNPIIEFSNLENLKFKDFNVSAIGGTFDQLHHGHK